MALNLRDGYQTAQDDDEYYGTPADEYSAAFAAGPGFGTQGPMNISTGGGSTYTPEPSPEFNVNLGPLYSYDKSGQKVYAEGDYAAPQYYSEASKNYVANSPSGGFQSLQYGEANSAANYPKQNFNWATTYNQAQKASTGIKSTGGGISQSRQPIANVQTSQTVFPSGAKYPTFKGPTWDEREIKKRTRKAAAPGLRALEMKVAQAMSVYYENPNVRKMVLRDTLAGYGIGMSNIMAQAGRTAQAEYGQEYSRMYSEAMNDFTRELGKLETQATKVSTTQPVYTKAGLEELTGGGQTMKTLS